MRTLRSRGLVLGIAAALLVGTAAFASTFLLDFSGYDYWAPADTYNAVGYVPSVEPLYLTFDYGQNEYTFSLQNAMVVSQTTLGPLVIYTFSGGTLDVYEDAIATGTAADFGANPPNAVSPATFSDGVNVLGGDFTQMQIVWNTTLQSGNLDAILDVNRGTQLANIPAAQRTGWTLAGLRLVPEVNPTPDGYGWQIDGQLFIDDPIPTQPNTWGGLKQQYLTD